MKIASLIFFLFVLFCFPSCKNGYFGKTIQFKDFNKITQPSKVIRLSLNGSGIEKLPDRIATFKNLHFIDLSNNPNLILADAIEIVTSCPSLEIVKLDSNLLANIPSNFIKLKQIKHLSLANNPNLDWKALGIMLLEFPHLTNLDLSNNKISILPPEFAQLDKINIFRLSNNLIRSDSSISILSKMKQMDILWLDANQMGILPQNIGNLNVKELYLDNNGLESIAGLQYCRALSVLHFGENELKKLPLKLFEMPKLLYLVVNKNKISSISERFKNEKISLKALVLGGNLLPDSEIKRAKKYFKGFFLLSF